MNVSKWTVLVVEDDRNIATCLAVRLGAAGYEVHIAHDAAAGVDAAMTFEPDLIILDITLPAGGGFSVAERLRDLSDSPAPVLFITASRQPGLRERAFDLGAAGFFEKPYDPHLLLATISDLLGPMPPAQRRKDSMPQTIDMEPLTRHELRRLKA
jgi:two-component system OmpR family response regulator